MRFDYCIGNPPYQGEAVGENKTNMPPVYHQFMDAAYETAEVVELITPARFLSDSGDTPKAWNRKMLNDEHFKVLSFEPDSTKIFSNASIKGGIAISIRSKNKKYGNIGVFTAFPELNDIMEKTVSAEDFEPLSNIVITRTAYRLTDELHKDHPEAEDQLSNGHKYDMSTNIFERLPQVFFQGKPDNRHEYIQILGREGNSRIYKWIRRDYVNKVENLEFYKVFLPKSNGSGAIGEVLSTPLIGEPLIGHTETFISIGKFQTKVEAENCMKFIKSKFARTLLGILKTTQDNPPEKWKFVPLQDFTSGSDIDWSQSVHGIDLQLYAKYGLSEEEIQFIESHVKEME